MAWDLELSESPVQVFEGHGSAATGVVVRGDDRQIISSSNDLTVRIWDVAIGAQAQDLLKSSAVKCVPIFGEDGMIALDLCDGTLTVLAKHTIEVLFETTCMHESSVD